jgi:hypothetical protein
MANPNGSRTVGTYLPADLYVRMHAYLRMNPGSVSKLVRRALETVLADFPAMSADVEPDAVDKSTKYYLKLRKVLPEIAALPPAEGLPHLLEARAKILESRPLFELACMEGIKYGDAYLGLLAYVDSLIASAQADLPDTK